MKRLLTVLVAAVVVSAGVAVAHPQTRQYLPYQLPQAQQYVPRVTYTNLRFRPNTGSIAPLRYGSSTLSQRYLYPYMGTGYAVFSQAQREFMSSRTRYSGAMARHNNTVYGYPNHVIRNGVEKPKGDEYMAILENNQRIARGEAYAWWNAPTPVFQVPAGYTEQVAGSGEWTKGGSDWSFKTYYFDSACTFEDFVECAESMATNYALNNGVASAPLYTSFRWIMTEDHGMTPSYTEYFADDQGRIQYTFTAFNPTNGKTLRIEAIGDADNYYMNATKAAQLFHSVQF